MEDTMVTSLLGGTERSRLSLRGGMGPASSVFSPQGQRPRKESDSLVGAHRLATVQDWSRSARSAQRRVEEVNTVSSDGKERSNSARGCRDKVAAGGRAQEQQTAR